MIGRKARDLLHAARNHRHEITLALIWKLPKYITILIINDLFYLYLINFPIYTIFVKMNGII